MDSFSNFFSAIPSWFGVILLVLFAVAGRLFKDTWKNKQNGWQIRCWTYGLISFLSFAVMVFGVFDFGWVNR